jgi:2-polyprenyl-6-methoxyphenol hydroxylase-like FAD-dependent oxidoreductase
MTRVLVVGAGIGGLATARALRQRGADVLVVERREGLPSTGLGINLPANAVRALDAVGLHDPLRKMGQQVRRREYRTASGALLFGIDEEDFWRRVGPSLAVRHERLLQALAEDQPVSWGCETTGLADAPNAVQVELSDGGSRSFDLVVGADGVRSTTRSAIVDAAAQRSAMTGASWRFVTDNPGVDCWTYWGGGGTALLLVPLAGGEVYGYATSTSSADAGSDPDWLAHAFDRYPAHARAAIASAPYGATPPRFDSVDEIRLTSWRRGRIVVVGDAAHATGPVWAQGAAMAVEDGLVLADLVARADDVPAALAAWEQRRQPRVRHVQVHTDRMSKLARMPDWLLRVVGPRSGPKGYRATYGPLRDLP